MLEKYPRVDVCIRIPSCNQIAGYDGYAYSNLQFT
jgi:hypothetical protein